MTKLTVLFAGFRLQQIGEERIHEIKQIVKREFYRAYNEKTGDMDITFGEARTGEYDIVIAYDNIPNVVNTMQKIKAFEQHIGKLLENVIPPECCYGGKVYVCHISKIQLSQTDKRGDAQDGSEPVSEEGDPALEYEKLAEQFIAEEPKFTFDRLVLSETARRQIEEAIAILENRDKLFNRWGLKSVMSPSVLLNLYGESGTGKTMAAEAIANRLEKKIIRASYADIESKYHGEGPKRLKGIFLAAKQQDAVLFIDEADSMLSARLHNVSQGSEQAINSMRSQLLISLENHDGIVIFATNLIDNYDKAFLTRLICVEMKRPDTAEREKIWHHHLYPVGDSTSNLHIPLAKDIDLKALAAYEFCGRDIRNAVKQACIMVVLHGGNIVCQKDLAEACIRIKSDLDALAEAVKK